MTPVFSALGTQKKEAASVGKDVAKAFIVTPPYPLLAKQRKAVRNISSVSKLFLSFGRPALRLTRLSMLLY